MLTASGEERRVVSTSDASVPKGPRNGEASDNAPSEANPPVNPADEGFGEASDNAPSAANPPVNPADEGFGDGEIIVDEVANLASMPSELLLEIAKYLQPVWSNDHSDVRATYLSSDHNLRTLMTVSRRFFSLLRPLFFERYCAAGSRQYSAPFGADMVRAREFEIYETVLKEGTPLFNGWKENIRELRINLGIWRGMYSPTVQFVEQCSNLRSLIVTDADFMAVVKIPGLMSKLESLRIQLTFDEGHTESKLGYARAMLRMSHLTDLTINSRLMPRYFNALVESTPSLRSVSLMLEEFKDDEEGDLSQQLSDNFVTKISRYVIEDSLEDTSDESAHARCLRHLNSKTGPDGRSLFSPEVIVFDAYALVNEIEDGGIWDEIIETNVRRVELQYFATSWLAEGLPRSLKELVVKELRLDNGAEDDLKAVVGDFVKRGGKITVKSIWDQQGEDEGLTDDEWLAELDFWDATLGHRAKVKPGT